MTTIDPRSKKESVVHEAIRNSVYQHGGEQQEHNEGPNGWKITLLTWIFQGGPLRIVVAILIAASLFAVVYVYKDAQADDKDRNDKFWTIIQTRQADDKMFMESVAISNASIAASMEQLVSLSKEEKAVDLRIEQILGRVERRIQTFTTGVDRDHVEQTRLIRHMYQKGMTDQ